MTCLQLSVARKCICDKNILLQRPKAPTMAFRNERNRKELMSPSPSRARGRTTELCLVGEVANETSRHSILEGRIQRRAVDQLF